MRLSVGAVNVRSGNFVYFDTATHAIRPEHIMGRAALPPRFSAVEIEGEATEQGLANQGWKDSHDAIFHADGRLAEGNIALAEVQGYVYAARRRV